MLVLTRKKGEQVQISQSIEVTVLAIEGGRVKLGFSCPPEIPIRRAELPRRSAATPLQPHPGQSLPEAVAR